MDHWIEIAEVKRNAEKLDKAALQKKASAIRSILPRYPVALKLLSLQDM